MKFLHESLKRNRILDPRNYSIGGKSSSSHYEYETSMGVTSMGVKRKAEEQLARFVTHLGMNSRFTSSCISFSSHSHLIACLWFLVLGIGEPADDGAHRSSKPKRILIDYYKVC